MLRIGDLGKRQSRPLRVSRASKRVEDVHDESLNARKAGGHHVGESKLGESLTVEGAFKRLQDGRPAQPTGQYESS